jgi:hypothetical protein
MAFTIKVSGVDRTAVPNLLGLRDYRSQLVDFSICVSTKHRLLSRRKYRQQRSHRRRCEPPGPDDVPANRMRRRA